ncbi:MAG: DUF2793 domain-containing protein [Hyphomicrobiales bacterium]
MSNSYFLELPFLAASQNQKHLTMNESLNRLDVVVQLAVLTADLEVMPVAPNNGDAYIIANGATGDWFGQDGKIAFYQDDAWKILTAKTGWLCWVVDEQKLMVFEGPNWQTYANRKNYFKPDVLVCEEMGYGQVSTNPPVTGWNLRYLNALKINELGAGMVFDQAASKFKLPIGNYWVKIMSAAVQVGKHKVDLKNINSSQHLIEGSCEYSEAGVTSTAALTRSVGEGELNVTDADHEFSLMHHVEVGTADNWRFGQAGEGPSINCKIEIWKL